MYNKAILNLKLNRRE